MNRNVKEIEKARRAAVRRGEPKLTNVLRTIEDEIYATVWERLRPIQRTAIVNSLDPCKVSFVNTSKSWQELEPQTREQMMRVDWEFSTGQKFEEFGS